MIKERSSYHYSEISEDTYQSKLIDCSAWDFKKVLLFSKNFNFSEPSFEYYAEINANSSQLKLTDYAA